MALSNRLPWISILTLALLLSAPAVAAQPVPAAAQWLPDGAVMVLHVEQPDALVDLVVSLHVPLPDSPDIQGIGKVIHMLATQAGTDWKGLIHKFTAGGITYAVYPPDSSVWILDAEDAATLESVRQFVSLIPRKAFYQEYPGVTAFSFDGKQYFAIAGSRLIIAARGETIQGLFGAQTMTKPKLAASPLYLASRQALVERSTVSFFVNMEMLNHYPPARKTLEADNWLDVLLNGAVKQSLRDSKWAALGLRVDGKQLALRAAVDGKVSPSGPGEFTLPPAGQGVLPNLTVPRQIAAISLWRDLGKFYGDKDKLFPEKTSSGILAENFMEIFFTGRDLTEEVFARFHPEMRIVVARQQFDPAIGRPQSEYPAAALVFRAEHADEFAEVLEEAWQKAIGLTNFTRGQQALPGLIFDRTAHAGAPITYCYFSNRAEKDRTRLPVRFNMRPALTRTGPYIIFSTTDGLAKDVIDAVNKEDARVPQERSDANLVLELTSPAEIVALLQANRTDLVRQGVVGKGAKPAQAEKELDTNIGLLQRVESARLSFRGSVADLELRLK